MLGVGYGGDWLCLFYLDPYAWQHELWGAWTSELVLSCSSAMKADCCILADHINIKSRPLPSLPILFSFSCSLICYHSIIEESRKERVSGEEAELPEQSSTASDSHQGASVAPTPSGVRQGQVSVHQIRPCGDFALLLGCPLLFGERSYHIV